MEITVYTKTRCPQCAYTKKTLELRECEFTEEIASEKLKEIASELGYSQAPIVTVTKGGKLIDSWSGFKDSKIRYWVEQLDIWN